MRFTLRGSCLRCVAARSLVPGSCEEKIQERRDERDHGTRNEKPFHFADPTSLKRELAKPVVQVRSL